MRHLAAIWLVLLGFHHCVIHAAPAEEGIALAIVYDTSGSMNDPVRGAGGKAEQKFVIASRAVSAVVDRLEKAAAGAPGGAPRKIHASLVIFGSRTGLDAVPFGPFKPEQFRAWLAAFKKPGGGTPLGEAVRFAAKPVLASPLRRRHIIVITDGMNTSGAEPSVVIPELRKAAAAKGAGLAIHFVAFDVAAAVFDPVKKLDCTVVSASDESQLNSQLGFILEQKILLEDEEPPVKKK